MKIFLTADLHAHRRGRFLSTLLDAELLPDGRLPDSGYLLMIGGYFQKSEQAAEYLSWTREPRRILLLLPPYQEGPITGALDWRIGYTQNTPVSLRPDCLSALLQTEVIYRIDGSDGNSDMALDHCWVDHTSHTRYWKVHANSGVLAATVLPLWSISLISSGVQLKQWLAWFVEQSGRICTSEEDSRPEDVAIALMPNDYTILVCCYGWNVATEAAITEKSGRHSVPILSLSEFHLPDCFGRLRRFGLLDDAGLTEKGLDVLQKSPYWGYAGHLKNTGEK